jgi:hypothetical protein
LRTNVRGWNTTAVSWKCGPWVNKTRPGDEHVHVADTELLPWHRLASRNWS